MKDKGFIRVGAAVPKIRVADLEYNKNQILDMIKKASKEGIELLVFPELSITGYTCGDLFSQSILIEKTKEVISFLEEETKDEDMILFIGGPFEYSGVLYNCSFVINRGRLIGIVPKSYLPNYKEFYEKRWFKSGKDIHHKEVEFLKREVPFGTDLLFKHKESPLKVALEICEDLWAPIAPSQIHCINGANLIVNLSASNDIVGKDTYRERIVGLQSAKCICGYIYSSAGYGESTTDLVFGGNAIICENGEILENNNEYSFENKLIYNEIDIDKINHDRRINNVFGDNSEHLREYKIIEFNTKSNKNSDFKRNYAPMPFLPKREEERDLRFEQIVNLQIMALSKRIEHINTKALVIGISGGLDSTLALLVSVLAWDRLKKDRKQIKGITMPGFGTTTRTYNNAIGLLKELGVEYEEINIKESVIQHFKDINHDIEDHSVVYENAQARERTQILMDKANQLGGLVIGTGDLSEIALGWSTYNGDHMSMYGINSGIPKTLIRYIIKWIADNKVEEKIKVYLKDIIETPVSPELLPPDEKGEIKQRTESLVGPYELHDFFLYHTIRNGFSPKKIYFIAKIAFKNIYDDETIYKWLRIFYKRFISQQFKRSAMPDGPKIGSVSLSPRGDWKMPSDVSMRLWIEELDSIKNKE